MSDLRESGSIEQDADMVILLHREDQYEKESPRAGEADFIVAKHRNGPTATITVAFQGHYSRFVDMARSDPHDERSGAVTVTGERLVRQHLAGPRLLSPAAVVAHLGAVQAQELPEAFWAVGQRTDGCTLTDVHSALDDGQILRTHVLRPTWHLVAREDVRWLLGLSAPRVRRMVASYDRLHGIDDAVGASVRRVCERELADGRHRTRAELGTALSAAGIAVAGGRLGQLMLRAELDGVVASGRMQGTSQTYALLDERAPDAPTISGDEALHELTVRYFTAHGPASAKDFGWWASLTVAQARSGIELAGDELVQVVLDGVACWSGTDEPSRPAGRPRRSASLLGPNDEFLVGYKETRALAGVTAAAEGWTGGVLDLGARTLLVDGQVCGVWASPSGATEVRVNLVERTAPRSGSSADRATRSAVTAAVERYGRFLSTRTTTIWT